MYNSMFTSACTKQKLFIIKAGTFHMADEIDKIHDVFYWLFWLSTKASSLNSFLDPVAFLLT